MEFGQCWFAYYIMVYNKAEVRSRALTVPGSDSCRSCACILSTIGLGLMYLGCLDT